MKKNILRYVTRAVLFIKYSVEKNESLEVNYYVYS